MKRIKHISILVALIVSMLCFVAQAQVLDGGKQLENEKSISWLSVAALIFGVGGVAVGCISLLRLKEINEKFIKYRERNKKNLQEFNNRLETLQQDLSMTRQKLDKSQTEIITLRQQQVAYGRSAGSSFGQDSDSPSNQTVTNAQKITQTVPTAAKEPIQLYCGLPRGGVFSNVSEKASRQSLYVISDNGGSSGKYSYIDSRDGAMIAARSTSDFLEPGCVISGNQNRNFSRVRTITPGTVRKTSNGWVIESKAVVELI